jgi:hypothetical protein
MARKTSPARERSGGGALVPFMYRHRGTGPQNRNPRKGLKEERTSFLKKRSKRPFFAGYGEPIRDMAGEQKSFGSFFRKSSTSAALPSSPHICRAERKGLPVHGAR